MAHLSWTPQDDAKIKELAHEITEWKVFAEHPDPKKRLSAYQSGPTILAMCQAYQLHLAAWIDELPQQQAGVAEALQVLYQQVSDSYLIIQKRQSELELEFGQPDDSYVASLLRELDMRYEEVKRVKEDLAQLHKEIAELKEEIHRLKPEEAQGL